MRRPRSFIGGLIVGVTACGSFAVLRAQGPAMSQPLAGDINRYQTCTSPNGTYLTDSTNGKVWILNPGPPVKDGHFTWSWVPLAESVTK